jgi:hypothetical protein
VVVVVIGTRFLSRSRLKEATFCVGTGVVAVAD